MMKLTLIIALLSIATVGLKGCMFVLKGDTNSYLQFPADIEDRPRIDKASLRIYPLQLLYDTTDLQKYSIKGYRYDSFSIQRVEDRISKRYDSFWLQQTGIPVQPNRPDDLSNLVNAEVYVRQRLMGDVNNNNAFRSITRVTSKYNSPDTLYHLIAEATLRQDICVGCASDGWQNDLFAVLHLRYAILHKNKVYYYRELIVPKPVERTKRNIQNTDAAKCFHDILDRVTLFYLHKDIARITK